MSEKVLVVAAHPDDEIIGLGGTVARHAKSGDIIKTLIIGEGGASRVSDDHDKEILEALKSSAKTAAGELGVDPPIMLNLPDNRLDSLSLLEIIKPIEEIIDNFNPDVVYTHFHSDLNIDHRITSDAVLTACRPLPNTSVKSLYLFFN